MQACLRLSGRQHAMIRKHLFPGDGNEAVAIALCGRKAGTTAHILCIHKIIPIPYDQCTIRAPDRITWSTDCLLPHVDEIIEEDFAVVKIHSHPEFYPKFSPVDDMSDRLLFQSIYGWSDSGNPHGSVVMLPTGELFGRIVTEDGKFHPLGKISVAGDEIRHWYSSRPSPNRPQEFTMRNRQLFGEATIEHLKRLSISVVGCSGTGSPVVEMLARLGVGHLLLVDPDRVEEKNLNRIYNTTMNDARISTPKVEVLARAINQMGLGTKVQIFPKTLFDPKVISAVAESDILVGCMDSYDGRYLLNKIAVYYNLPYIDVGVTLLADGNGGIEKIAGSIHYLQPDGSSLLSRGVITLEKVRASGLRRVDPTAYSQLLKEKYIQGVNEARPAVISVNTEFAAKAVTELLARLHPFRSSQNKDYAWRTTLITDDVSYNESDGTPCSILSVKAGKGDVAPLLDMIELGVSN